MVALPLDRHAGITVEQYFALEASSEIRREFYHGDLIARIGMSFNHNLITSNVGASLNIQLQHRAECVALVSAMLVQVSEAVYFYPDVLAACDAQYSDDDRDVLLNPCVVIEVASENSTLYDRVTKLDAYKRMPSVQEILIIDQHRVWIEQHTRMANGWFVREFSGMEDTLTLDSIGCTLVVSAVYAKVTFEG